MSTVARSFLKELPITGTINKTENVFHHYGANYLNEFLKAACRKAGVKGVTTHEFGRDSFVSQRLGSGFTNEQIALVTDNLASIKKYSHMDLESKRKIINFQS